MEWNMEWNGIFSNKYVNTNMDCVKHCSSILYEQNVILDKIKKLEAEHKNKPYSEEARDKYDELNQKIKSLQDTHSVCMMDCERRKRDTSVSVKEHDHPIDDTLRREFEQDSDDDDNIDGGGNKRRPRLPRRRRSFRNRTHRQPRQTRRNQRRNTRRRNGRHHRK